MNKYRENSKRLGHSWTSKTWEASIAEIPVLDEILIFNKPMSLKMYLIICSTILKI